MSERVPESWFADTSLYCVWFSFGHKTEKKKKKKTGLQNLE